EQRPVQGRRTLDRSVRQDCRLTGHTQNLTITLFSGEVDKTFVKDWDEASQPVEDPEPEVPLRK
ncbi:hypothetical protein ACQKD0_16800, partial [Vreelandella aquamarina]|uniref:hypothetical protein n=1 Tax=Vreelandella aquamarina TaxID=77097 RepID=UPI003CFFF6D3